MYKTFKVFNYLLTKLLKKPFSISNQGRVSALKFAEALCIKIYQNIGKQK